MKMVKKKQEEGSKQVKSESKSETKSESEPESGKKKDDEKYEKLRQDMIKRAQPREPPKYDDRFHILKLIDKMITHQLDKTKLKIKIPEETYFTCNRCGECCKKARFRISVTISDCVSWINSGKNLYLRALEHNRGHPKDLLYLITKQTFQEEFQTKHGSFFYNQMVNINPSLQEISDNDKEDCVFFNSALKECTIYQFRPLHCVIYPYHALFKLNLASLYVKAYHKVAKLPMKEKGLKNFLQKSDFLVIKCPPITLEKNDQNRKSLKNQKWIRRFNELIIGDLFSGSLYFENRKDILEQVMIALFS